MIKAAFFDIDGTLLSFKTHQVSQGTIEAFDALHKKGIRTFISTGRPKLLIPELPVQFDGYVTMNGGYVFVGEQVLFKQPIIREESDRWLHYAKEHEIATMTFLEHGIYANRIDPVGLALQRELSFQMPSVISEDELIGREVFQFIVLTPAERDNELKAMLPNCAMPRWHSAFTDLLHESNNKAVGMEHMLRHFGLQREECIAFGDGGNDLEMLEFAGIGVAMGNASDKVKEKADYVTTSVDEEGIFTALSNLHML